MEIKLNLASKPYINRQSLRLWLLLATAVLVLSLVFSVFYAYQNYRQLQILDERSEQLRGEPAATTTSVSDSGFSAEKYAAVKDEVAFASEVISADQFRWTDMLGRLEALTPKDVRIVSVQPNFKQGTLQLSCRAKEVTAMTEFVDALLSSDDLSRAFLKSHSEVETQQQGFRQTEISFSLSIEEAF